MTPRRRQLWLDGVEKWCDHEFIDEIRSEAGAVIAEVCKACALRLAEHGRCAGCDKPKRLTCFVPSKRKAYCSDDCRRASLSAARVAKVWSAEQGGSK